MKKFILPTLIAIVATAGFGCGEESEPSTTNPNDVMDVAGDSTTMTGDVPEGDADRDVSEKDQVDEDSGKDDVDEPDVDDPDTTEDATTDIAEDVADDATAMCDGPCDDGDPCNGVETCVEGACAFGEGLENGTECERDGDVGYCNEEACVAHTCGDGVVEEGTESCDDGNLINGDGCEDDCTLTCETDTDCDDGDICTGMETCDTSTNTCTVGSALADGESCGDKKECRGGACSGIDCGDNVVSQGEECDDGNMTDGDGCDTDCTYSCVSDTECNDNDVCNGIETCNLNTFTCETDNVPNCSDLDDCTRDTCDPIEGCKSEYIDDDGDGDGPGANCGNDCNDNDDTIYQGAGELCDNKDNDCDGQTDEVVTNWYLDCDGDGYALKGASKTSSCDKPPQPLLACKDAKEADWTSRSPLKVTNQDCIDTVGAAHPGQTKFFSKPYGLGRDASFDYNCNGKPDPKFPRCDGTESCTGFGSETCMAGTVACGISGTTRTFSRFRFPCPDDAQQVQVCN